MIQIFIALIVQALAPIPATAEPWIANRYAQNCSACHSPNRYNVPLLQRRCTLSCQGCHVNPNGGGMRNRYGAWNQNRFLRSAYWPKFFQNDYKMPAVISKQLYHEDRTSNRENRSSKTGKEKNNNKPAISQAAKKLKQKWSLKEIINYGYPLITTNNLDYNEEVYKDHKDWRILPDRIGFMKRLAKGDPYREELAMHYYASGDLRYFFINQSGDASVLYKDQWKNFLMSVDLDLRLRPLKRYLSFVFETRYFGQPSNPDVESVFLTSGGIRTRSAYFLIDEIPFNTYVMGGIYRPLFGHYTPDHTSLAQKISGFGQNSQFKTFSIGTAPNVPFLYLHKVFPHDDFTSDPNTTKHNDATVISLGGRFVTLGLSAMLSTWRGTYRLTQTGADLVNNLTSLTFGAFFFDRLVTNLELLRVEREFAPGAKDAGVVYTGEFKYKLFRENYAQLNLAFSNIAVDLKEGDASQVALGFKSFLYSGLELEFMYVMNHNSKDNGTSITETNYNTMQLQAHLFF